MSGNFKVGEVCIGQNITSLPVYNGCECVIVEGLSMRRGYEIETGVIYEQRMQYAVQWSDGFITYADPSKLRRKQPPSGELSILNMFVVAPPQRTKEIA